MIKEPQKSMTITEADITMAHAMTGLVGHDSWHLAEYREEIEARTARQVVELEKKVAKYREELNDMDNQINLRLKAEFNNTQMRVALEKIAAGLWHTDERELARKVLEETKNHDTATF